MEFKSLKNIETSFRQIRLFGIVYTAACALVVVCSVVCAFRFAEAQRQKIYVLDGGKSLMLALSQDTPALDCPAEAREHVRRFHELFFTLSPEKSAIEHNVKRALLLADKSAYNYYADFAEKGFYNRIIAGNINQVLQVDSVVCNFDRYPYEARTYARQMIIRESKRDGTHACDRLPPAQRKPLGRQPERFYHRGLHGAGEQGHPDHRKMMRVWER